MEPYRGVGDAHDPLAATRRKLRFAGGVAAASAVLWSLYCAGLVLFAVAGGSGAFSQGRSSGEDDVVIGLIVGCGGGAYLLLVTLANVVGAVGLLRLRPWARLGATAAMIGSFLGSMCGCVFGLLPAIAILVVIMDPNVERVLGGEDAQGFRPPS